MQGTDRHRLFPLRTPQRKNFLERSSCLARVGQGKKSAFVGVRLWLKGLFNVNGREESD